MVDEAEKFMPFQSDGQTKKTQHKVQKPELVTDQTLERVIEHDTLLMIEGCESQRGRLRLIEGFLGVRRRPDTRLKTKVVNGHVVRIGP